MVKKQVAPDTVQNEGEGEGRESDSTPFLFISLLDFETL